MAPKKLIEAKDWAGIEALAREAAQPDVKTIALDRP